MSLMGILDRVSDATAFDKVIEPARRAVQGALRPQALKDFLHGHLAGASAAPGARAGARWARGCPPVCSTWSRRCGPAPPC